MVVWTHYTEFVPVQTYKLVHIERDRPGQVIITMNYPDDSKVEDLTKTHGLPHKTSLDSETQTWILEERAGQDGLVQTHAEIKASFSGKILSGAVSKILSKAFHERIDSRFKLLETAVLPRTAEAITYDGQVKPIIDGYCVGCHQSGGIAPFALNSYEQVKRYGTAIIDAVASGRMPPSAPHQIAEHPLKYDFSISPDKLETLRAWVKAGSPMGDAAIAGTPLPIQRPSITRVDKTMGMATPYTVKAGSKDEYRCFIMGEPTSDEFYVTGYRVRSSNKALVHHVALFAFDPEYSDIVSEMDAKDSDIGYPCFGAPSTEDNQNLPSRLLGVSTFPSANFTFPQGTGIFIKPGTRIVLQMHYSVHGSEEAVSREDQTQIDLQIEKKVDKPLLTPFFSKIEWITDGEMKIPAGQKKVIHSFSQDPLENTPFIWSKGEMSFEKGIHLYGVYPHQHLLGKGLRFWKEDAKGKKEMLFDNWGNYRFHFQWSFEYEKPIVIAPGEKLGLECLWDNSAGNQPTLHGAPKKPQDVAWGEGTNEEMCVMILTVSES
ncbi:MAG TPA: hypothetical protein VFO10_26105 [Oligoflexus sp.]|uniref:monooxygenase n=1 Tax=Oligoflexus sp. TaxID=1971216 RepID=UPI002D7E5B69|nr:hypothetical protein [Oligoflexus sp.]HET9240765.1 hypothetical protein [Oligoflexus sp.]